MNKLLGLDLDGTLLDSRLRHVIALQHAAKALAVPLSEAQVQTYSLLKSNGSSGIEALQQLRISAAKEISQRWVEIIESEEMLAADRLYSDTITALKRAQDQGYSFVLVTGRQNPEAARHQIASLGLKDFFREIFVVNLQNRLQSKATVTRGYNLSAIVGDTEVDSKWAFDLGVEFYASSFGFRSKNFWDNRQVISYASLSAAFDAIVSAVGGALPDHRDGSAAVRE